MHNGRVHMTGSFSYLSLCKVLKIVCEEVEKPNAACRYVRFIK